MPQTSRKASRSQFWRNLLYATAFMLSFVSHATLLARQVEPRSETVDVSWKLEEDFTGVHLGCSMEELKQDLKRLGRPFKLDKKSVDGPKTTYMVRGNHQLNGAEVTGYIFCEEKLASIIIAFVGNECEKNYDALKLNAEKKFGSIKDSVVFAGKHCSGRKGGMAIQLTYKKEFTDSDTLIVVVVHERLGQKMVDDELKRKAESIGGF